MSTQPEHCYYADDRCACGGIVTWFDDPPQGHGCEVEGKPWDKEVRLRDPQERRDDVRRMEQGMIWDKEALRYVWETDT